MMLDPFFDHLRAWHDRYARVVLAGIAILMLPLMVMSTVATVDNWRQDNERDELLACFDQFAGASSSSSKAVREASVAKDVATENRDDALNAEGLAFKRLVASILDESATAAQFKLLNETLNDRVAAARALDEAQAELDRARRENPVPDPPSEFCSVQP